jgi:hypothetical protein
VSAESSHWLYSGSHRFAGYEGEGCSCFARRHDGWFKAQARSRSAREIRVGVPENFYFPNLRPEFATLFRPPLNVQEGLVCV